MVASLLVIAVCLCGGPSAGGRPGTSAYNRLMFFLILGVLLIAAGVALIVWLAREVARSSASPQAVLEGNPGPAPQLVVSPLGRKTVDRLVLALGAQIVVSALAWIIGQLTFWTRPHQFAPHNWILLLLAPYLLYHIPYAILIYLLVKRPDRLALTYSIAVPSVMILQAWFSLSVVSYYYVHQPTGFLLLVLPWAIHILILVFAYQAIQQVGIHPQPASLFVAAIVTFLFFTAIHAATPFLYRALR